LICFENPVNKVTPVCNSNISPEKTGVHIPDIVSVNVTDLQINLADKFRFPSKDTIDPNSWTQQFTELECLQHIINTSACKLDSDHLEFWNKVALRDCQYPELSSCGIQATKFDIREQLSIYKKNKAKIDYVHHLKDLGLSKRAKSQQPKEEEISNLAVKVGSTEFLQSNEKQNIDRCNVLQFTLSEITQIFYSKPKRLLPIMKTILNSPNLNKKSRKKMLKFEKLIINKNTLNFAKANFYLRNTSKYLKYV
jgi:hypothetical protein